MGDLDKDGDGEIDFNEFRSVLAKNVVKNRLRFRNSSIYIS